MTKPNDIGISAYPWHADKWDDGDVESPKIRDAKGNVIAQPSTTFADASMMAAAPVLYEALHEAVIESCHDCNAYVRNGSRCAEVNSECFIQRWRKALEKAEGKR